MHKLRPHQAAGILISLLGLVVMAGYWTNERRLIHLTPEHFPMAFNVALCFLMAGAALVLPESRPEIQKKGQQAVGLLIAVLAGLSGLQDLLNSGFGIDELFATQWFDDRNPHPGRMAPLTSVGLLLVAGCFLLKHWLPSSRMAQLTIQMLIHAILAVGIFSLVGYSLKLELLYGWYRFARMAPHTAMAFVVLGGALWSVWFRTLKLSGVYADREDKRIAAFATLILFVLAFTGGLTGFVLSAQRTEASLKQSLEATLANRTQLLETVLDDRVKLAGALATDPALLDALRQVHAGRSTDRSATLGKVEERFLGTIFAGMAVLATDGNVMMQRGQFETAPRLALPLRRGATLLWKSNAILQINLPIMQNGKQLGTLILQRAMPAIDKLLADARLLGETGDIAICAALSRDRMRCLPTRLVPEGYPAISRFDGGKPWPASRALDAQTGMAAVADRRGQQVIAAYGPVPGFGLALVVKQDTVELLAPIRAQMTDLLVLLTLLVVSSLVLLRAQLLPLVRSLLKAKRAADINEAKIRSVVDNVADGLITIDELGMIESINPAAAAMFGYSLHEVAGSNVDMLIPPHLKAAHASGMARYARTGQPSMVGGAPVEVNGLRKNGSEFPMQISVREMLVEGKRMFVGIVRDISERRQAEHEMRTAEERFRLVSQATNDVVWDLDFATDQTWWNEAVTRQFGYPPEQVDSGPDWWRDRVHPDDRDALLRAVDRELNDGCQSWAMDYRFAKADGSYIYVHDRAHIIRDSAGNPTRAIGAMMDVTERKLADARLRRSEARFSEVFNLSPVAITVTRVADGAFLDVNDALLQMLGYGREEIIGNTSVAIEFWYTPEERAAMVERIKHGSVRDFPMRGRSKEGILLDLLVAVDLVELSGEPHLFCFLTNITERKRAEEALRESEEKFRSIVETTMDWIWSIDAEGRLLYANPALTDILGYQPDELLGTNILDCLHAEVRAEVTNDLATLTAHKDTWSNLLLRWRHKDGSDRYTQSSAIPMLNEHGELLGYRGSDHDITLLKRYEQELEDAKHKAEAANQAKSEFLANMSHEIRTPMNGVIGLTGLVLKTQLSAQQRGYLGLMKSSADSLLRLLNDILDFSKMEARKLELDLVEFDVREAVGNTLKTFSASASEKGVELAYHVAPDVPVLLVGDPGRLAQIIVNLAGNALKFTKQGEVVVRLAVEPQGGGSTLLHISVADSGIGMSAEQQANIFAAFAQADSSTTRQYGGTGLGLTIVSQLITLMGGAIRVESEPGKGSTFHLTMRLGLPEHQPATAIQQQAPALKDMPVLVVDDNRSNRLILAECLISWGMQPVLAADGCQALQEMREQAALGTPFPLVLLDAGMPQFDGFELARAIKASAPILDSATIMMLSSSDPSAEIARCNALGVTRFVCKPLKQSELFDAIVTATSVAPTDRIGGLDEALPMRVAPARKLNVLVAEDHPINQVLIAAILTGLGHTFSIARNGLEVLQLLDYEPPEHPFDVVLMDGQMPEMDGYQATAEIRRRERVSGKHLHIIAVTANAMKDDRDICLAAGMDDYLTKPIDSDQLLERLEASQPQAGRPDLTRPVAQPAPPGHPKAFDFDSALKRTRGKLTLLKQLAHLFLQDLPNSLADLQLAIAAGDARGIERLAHRLRGAAFTVSAEPLAEAAHKLEQIGKRKEFDRVQEAARELQARAVELATELATLTENDK